MDEEVQESLLTVHVCGAVRREGVYSLPAGSRIRDAVDAAGGFSGDADRSCLNLAMKIEDAWQIRVPTKEEAEALRLEQGRSGAGTAVPGASPGLSGTSGLQGAGTAKDEAGKGNQEEKINLNTASKEQLMKIPGVGEAKAQRIIEYREQNGRFEAIEDLMKVPGIKDASFQKMKEYITV
jgi:competence protein ComEA